MGPLGCATPPTLDRHEAKAHAVAESPVITGNRATLLQDGPATYASMFAAMEGAREYILIEMYIIEDDEIGKKFSDAWLKKRKQGIPVSLMYDSVGSMNTPQEFFQRLRDGGITVIEFNPVNPAKAKKGWDINERDHRKLLIVDGRVGFVGGINISGVYSSGSSAGSHKRGKQDTRPWRDTQVRIDGPAVVDLQKSYLEVWAKATKEPPPAKVRTTPAGAAGKESVRVVAGWADADEQDRVNPIYATFLSTIQNAKTSAHLTMAYFVPDPQTLDALAAAARRGVDVTLVLPSFTDFWGVFYAGRSKYDQLLAAGVKIHERKDRLLHSKTAVIDGNWSTVGSANLDWRSFMHNHELNVVILGSEFGAEMEAAFQRDIANSQTITLEAWRDRPVKDRTLELASRIWEYWF